MSEFQWQRAVIKVGSALIAEEGENCSARYLLSLARFISASREQGKQVILVSSGSVAAGKGEINHGSRPSVAEKQAMAAIGQTRMMANWSRFFDVPCAQVLLTYDDLRNRIRYVNIKNTLTTLLLNDVIPIVNENDTVAVDELKVGDNDNLAAYTAIVSEADSLIICSDIDGLYTEDPRLSPEAKLIPVVEHIDQNIYDIAGGPTTTIGTGGMRTKIEAAEKSAKCGIQTVILNGRKGEMFDGLLGGKQVGTLFKSHESRGGAKRHWLKHTLRAKGKLQVDEGAAHALLQRGASLLPSGISDVSGMFESGDGVDIFHKKHKVAKGIVQYSAAELHRIQGIKSEEIESILGYSCGEVIVHRDDMVLI